MKHQALDSREMRTAMLWLLVIGVLRFMQWPGNYLSRMLYARYLTVDQLNVISTVNVFASIRGLALGLLVDLLIGLMMYRRSRGEGAWAWGWLGAGVLLGPFAAAVWIAVRAGQGVRGAGLHRLPGDSIPAVVLVAIWCALTIAPLGVIAWAPGWFPPATVSGASAFWYAFFPLLLSIAVPVLAGAWLFIVARREERAAWVWLALGLSSGVAGAALYYVSRLYDRGEDAGHGFQVVPMAQVAAVEA